MSMRNHKHKEGKNVFFSVSYKNAHEIKECKCGRRRKEIRSRKIREKFPFVAKERSLCLLFALNFFLSFLNILEAKKKECDERSYQV